MAKYCSNCGTKLEDGAKFCPECGKKITGYPSQDDSEKSSPLDTSIGVAVGILLFLIIIVILFSKPNLMILIISIFIGTFILIIYAIIKEIRDKRNQSDNKRSD